MNKELEKKLETVEEAISSLFADFSLVTTLNELRERIHDYLHDRKISNNALVLSDTDTLKLLEYIQLRNRFKIDRIDTTVKINRVM